MDIEEPINQRTKRKTPEKEEGSNISPIQSEHETASDQQNKDKKQSSKYYEQKLDSTFVIREEEDTPFEPQGNTHIIVIIYTGSRNDGFSEFTKTLNYGQHPTLPRHFCHRGWVKP